MTFTRCEVDSSVDEDDEVDDEVDKDDLNLVSNAADDNNGDAEEGGGCDADEEAYARFVVDEQYKFGNKDPLFLW